MQLQIHLHSTDIREHSQYTLTVVSLDLMLSRNTTGNIPTYSHVTAIAADVRAVLKFPLHNTNVLTNCLHTYSLHYTVGSLERCSHTHQLQYSVLEVIIMIIIYYIIVVSKILCTAFPHNPVRLLTFAKV